MALPVLFLFKLTSEYSGLLGYLHQASDFQLWNSSCWEQEKKTAAADAMLGEAGS